MVAVGGKHSVAITEDGAVYSWGYGESDRLGHNDTQARLVPTLVASGAVGSKRVSMAACGASHTAVVTETGAVYTWGDCLALNGALLSQSLEQATMEEKGLEFLSAERQELVNLFMAFVSIDDPNFARDLLHSSGWLVKCAFDAYMSMLGESWQSWKIQSRRCRRLRWKKLQGTMNPSMVSVFETILSFIPCDDLRTWPAERTIMLMHTSKRIRAAVRNIIPPAWVVFNDHVSSICNNLAALQSMFVRLGLSPEDGAALCVQQHGFETVCSYVEYVLTQLAKLPTWCKICVLCLNKCKFRGANVDSLAGVFAKCPALTSLHLKSCDIGDEGFSRLAERMPQFPALEILDLASNGITAQGADLLAGVLVQCPALSFLNLDENRIGAEGAASLAPVLAKCPAMFQLDLERNMIGEEGAGALAVVLSQCARLSYLNLARNWIEDEGVRRLVEGLVPPSLSEMEDEGTSTPPPPPRFSTPPPPRCFALSHLNLSDNGIGEGGAVSLAEVLSQCPYLFHLDLQNNRIEAEGARRLSGVLGQCRALSYLDLDSNAIGAEGAGSVFQLLVDCPRLSCLKMPNNGIGAEGAGMIARVLKGLQIPALSHLNLSDNGIGGEGARTLAEVLMHCPALCHLSLGSNWIGDEGVGRLAEVMSQCPVLSHLELQNNSIGVEGAATLARVLPLCSALSHLNLADNVLGDEGLIMLFEALRPGDYDVLARCSLCEQCPTLRFVDLKNNGMMPFSSGSWKAFMEFGTKVLGYHIDVCGFAP
jgi:Ran GTPase-activating protein (RanGAP) involved in mRNA processing and transport